MRHGPLAFQKALYWHTYFIKLLADNLDARQQLLLRNTEEAVKSHLRMGGVTATYFADKNYQIKNF
jgi:hypothetical protein